MALPPRLIPLLAEFGFMRERLFNRLAGPRQTAETAQAATESIRWKPSRRAMPAAVPNLLRY